MKSQRYISQLDCKLFSYFNLGVINMYSKNLLLATLVGGSIGMSFSIEGNLKNTRYVPLQILGEMKS